MDKRLLVFKALGEETKFKILSLLMDGEYCACEIPLLIKRTQSNTSMHLAKLHKWGLIKSRREGKMIIYSIKNKLVIDIFRLLNKKVKVRTKWKENCQN